MGRSGSNKIHNGSSARNFSYLRVTLTFWNPAGVSTLPEYLDLLAWPAWPAKIPIPRNGQKFENNTVVSRETEFFSKSRSQKTQVWMLTTLEKRASQSLFHLFVSHNDVAINKNKSLFQARAASKWSRMNGKLLDGVVLSFVVDLPPEFLIFFTPSFELESSQFFLYS